MTTSTAASGQQIPTRGVLRAVLAEVPLETTLQDEHEAAGPTVAQALRFVPAFTVQGHQGAVISQQLSEPGDRQRHLIHSDIVTQCRSTVLGPCGLGSLPAKAPNYPTCGPIARSAAFQDVRLGRWDGRYEIRRSCGWLCPGATYPRSVAERFPALPSLFLRMNAASIEMPKTSHSTGVSSHSCQIAQPQKSHTPTCPPDASKYDVRSRATRKLKHAWLGTGRSRSVVRGEDGRREVRPDR